MGKYEFKVMREGEDCLWVVEVGKFHHILTIQKFNRNYFKIYQCIFYTGSVAQKNFKLFLTGLSAKLSQYRKCTAWDWPGPGQQ